MPQQLLAILLALGTLRDFCVLFGSLPHLFDVCRTRRQQALMDTCKMERCVPKISEIGHGPRKLTLPYYVLLDANERARLTVRAFSG